MAPSRFQSFVVFAEMRTGSNFLEANLNSLENVTCYGEAFNPHFMGYPDQVSLLGVSQNERDGNPLLLLKKLVQAGGLTGFRYFHDHDPRVLNKVLEDNRCAKIILTRDPVESYVSWKIAQSTGQWKLTNIKRRKEATVHFDPLEFDGYARSHANYYAKISRQLQIAGQTAFRIRYEDLKSIKVINGLAKFLGTDNRLEKLDNRLKVQNPEPISSKVSNLAEMKAALTERWSIDLELCSDFEPRRFAAVPTYVAGAKTPLLYLPIDNGLMSPITGWMATLDGVQPDDLLTSMSQRELRRWKRAHSGHRSFTVVRHPVVRAHNAYCHHILGMGPQAFRAIRRVLIKRFNLILPSEGPDGNYGIEEHRDGFLVFLKFLKANLNGQTSIRTDSAWCSQIQTVNGFSGFAAPDIILREDELKVMLPDLAQRVGAVARTFKPDDLAEKPFALSAIYDDEIEEMTATAYHRDYMIFGFARWL